MSAEKTGKNGPSLPVPPEEEEEPAAAAAAGAAGRRRGQPLWRCGGEAGSGRTGGRTPLRRRRRRRRQPSEFSDAVAVQIPSQVPAGARKPYFIFGDAQNSVDLWFFDLARPEPLQFTGKGSADIAANDTGDLTGVASYDQGEWSVIFKRPLRPSSGAPFTPGQFMPVAFSVWDGFSRERGNRRGLSLWYSLYVEPEVVPSAAGPMMRTALFILVFELVVIGWVRWRQVPPACAPEALRRVRRSVSGGGSLLGYRSIRCTRAFTFLSITQTTPTAPSPAPSRWARRIPRSWSAATSTRQSCTTIASGRWSTRCPRSTSTRWSSSASGRSTTA